MITGWQQVCKAYPRFMEYKCTVPCLIEVLKGDRLKLKIAGKTYIYHEDDIKMIEAQLAAKEVERDGI